jgi:hypothetical protein
VKYIDFPYVLIVSLAVHNNEAQLQVSVRVMKINELRVSITFISHMLSGCCQHGMVCAQIGDEDTAPRYVGVITANMLKHAQTVDSVWSCSLRFGNGANKYQHVPKRYTWLQPWNKYTLREEHGLKMFDRRVKRNM